MPAEPLLVEAWPDGRKVVAIPTPLTEAHPSTYWGGCNRQVYARNTLVVATFTKTPRGYRPIMSPFARAVEDVEGPDGIWVKAATLYARLAALPADRQRAAIEAEVARLEADHGDPDAAAIASDLRHQLSEPADAAGQ